MACTSKHVLDIHQAAKMQCIHHHDSKLNSNIRETIFHLLIPETSDFFFSQILIIKHDLCYSFVQLGLFLLFFFSTLKTMLTTQELLPVVLTLAAIVATYFYLSAKSNVWASHSNHKSPQC